MSEVKGRTEDAVEFLRQWRPGGPWVITAIWPDEPGKIKTQTFRDEVKLHAFIDRAQGNANVYFTVNRVLGDVSSKPKKVDIGQMDWLHVDLDPRVPEPGLSEEQLADHNTSERDRILELLRSFNPQPSVITDSGGGYQGFWRLQEGQETGGSEPIATQLEAYNRQIERLLGGDHCHNIDRIMRVPGTINLPDAKKRKKGRKAALARIVEWSDRAYPLSVFTPAPAIQSSQGEKDALSGGRTVKISSNLRRYSTDELPQAVTDYTKMLIVHGRDEDRPDQYGSRSEVLFKVCVDLVRAGCDDDMIAAVITDQDHRISESVLDKPRPEVYAARQIARAREEAVDKNLRILNEKHAVIEDMGGKCRVISEVYDQALKRTRLSKQSFEDFRNRYSNKKVQVGRNKDDSPIYMPLGKWWLSHEMRRQYETIVFAPGQETDNAYNLWQGFACEARPGDCSLLIQHIRNETCSGNEEHFNYLMGWMARTVQYPATAGETAVVLKGKRGTGKGTPIKWFGRLFGRHFIQISNSSHLVGNFNAHLQDCVVVFADEAFFAGDRKHESVLKTLITEETIPIELKGVDVVMAPNYTHIFMAANQEWVVPAGPDERRYFVLEVGEKHKQDTAYFDALNRQMENGGLEAFLHFLLTYDISKFNVREVPKTEALREQQVQTMSAAEQWWYERLSEGRLTERDESWTGKVQKKVLQDDYYMFATRARDPRPLTPVALGRFLKRVVGPDKVRVVQEAARVFVPGPYGEMLETDGRPYVYYLPDLQTSRDSFEKFLGGRLTWISVVDPEVVKQEKLPEVKVKPAF